MVVRGGRSRRRDVEREGSSGSSGCGRRGDGCGGGGSDEEDSDEGRREGEHLRRVSGMEGREERFCALNDFSRTKRISLRLERSHVSRSTRSHVKNISRLKWRKLKDRSSCSLCHSRVGRDSRERELLHCRAVSTVKRSVSTSCQRFSCSNPADRSEQTILQTAENSGDDLCSAFSELWLASCNPDWCNALSRRRWYQDLTKKKQPKFERRF